MSGVAQGYAGTRRIFAAKLWDVSNVATGYGVFDSAGSTARRDSWFGTRDSKPEARIPNPDFPYTAPMREKTAVMTGGFLTVWALLALTLGAQEPAASGLMKQPAVRAALDALKVNEPQTIADQIRFCE